MTNDQSCREAFEKWVNNLHNGMHSLICNSHRHNQFAAFKAGWGARDVKANDLREALELAREWILECLEERENPIPSITDILDMEKINDALKEESR